MDSSSFLTLRLSEEDARTVETLRAATGLSKTDVVKQALRLMASSSGLTARAGTSLYDIRMAQGSLHAGDASRQSSRAKKIVREIVRAKHGR